MQTNQRRVNTNRTYEGAPASKINPEQMLRRAMMSCMLWENQFYEDGVDIADRIQALVKEISEEKLSQIVIEARTLGYLRHAPLFLAVCMAKEKKLTANVLYKVIQRVDELMEFLSLYWQKGKSPISNQIKKGLARSFNKFTEYQFAKYNRDKAIKLRDVMFTTHPKPMGKEQQLVFEKIVNNTLDIPDTWETALSAEKDKKETWLRLINENKLGGLAMLRNIRNMKEAGLTKEQIAKGLRQMKTDYILPYRFIAASKFAPDMEPEIEEVMLKCIQGRNNLIGKTILLVDVSGSMNDPISDKSDLKRIDAACGLGIIARELFNDIQIFTFSNSLVEVPIRHGFALRDAIMNSQQHRQTYMGKAISQLNKLDYDRLIIITDEQSHDAIPDPKGKSYIINIASYQNGVGYGKYNHINGWSESVLDYIIQMENLERE
jgi:hypothetical protein